MPFCQPSFCIFLLRPFMLLLTERTHYLIDTRQLRFCPSVHAQTQVSCAKAVISRLELGLEEKGSGEHNGKMRISS